MYVHNVHVIVVSIAILLMIFTLINALDNVTVCGLILLYF